MRSPEIANLVRSWPRWSGLSSTFIDTGNEKAPIAQRGNAKHKRSDLRLAGPGLAVTRDGGIPLTWPAYPGNRRDVTQFPAMIGQLRGQYAEVCAAARCPRRT